MTGLAWGITAYLLLNTIALAWVYEDEDPATLTGLTGWRRVGTLAIVAIFSGVLIAWFAPEAVAVQIRGLYWRLNQRRVITLSERALKAVIEAHGESFAYRHLFPAWEEYAEKNRLHTWAAWITERREQLDAKLRAELLNNGRPDRDQPE